MKIRLTEGQYKRIFLNDIQKIDRVYINEQKDTYDPKTGEDSQCYGRACDRGRSKFSDCYQSSATVPYWYTLKDPFGDGFDYQWRLWADCSRRWIRRGVKHRNEGKDLYSKSTDTSFNDVKDIFIDRHNDELNKKLFREKDRDVKKRRQKLIDEYNKNNSYDYKIKIFRQTVKDLKKMGFGGMSNIGRGDIIPYDEDETFGGVAKAVPTMNKLYAETAIRAMKYINTIQDNKGILQGGLGDGIVCVTALGTSCKGSQPYLTTKNFSLNLAKILAGSGIGVRKDFQGPEIPYPASYIVMLHGFYFDYGKIYQDLKDTFKSDPHAFKSSLFPDGWWNFFTQAYGIGGNEGISNFKNATNIMRQLSASDIVGGKIETLNQYDKGGSLWSLLGDCFTDYHCVLDIASIATLVIPGVGLIASAGLDFINAAAYGMEASSAETVEERDAALIAGGLTLFGGMMGGGVGQTRRLLTKGSRNPKIYNYVDEVIKRIDNELPKFKNVPDVTKSKEVAKIYKETVDKYKLTNNDFLVAHDIIKDFSKIDPSVGKLYTDALKKIDGPLTKIQRANLTKVARESKFRKLVEENGGDVVTSLNKYMRTKAGKEALVEAGLFITLTEVMEKPEVQKWVGEGLLKVKATVNPTVRNIVQSEGYDWVTTKEIFNSNGERNDNTLLKMAWLKGWRPWPEGVEPTEVNVFETGILWLIENPKYQTETFKKNFSQIGVDNVERKVKPEKEEDRIEGVIYYDTKEELKQRSNIDDNISNEEIETTSSTLDQYI
jgi:hypothetical protein